MLRAADILTGSGVWLTAWPMKLRGWQRQSVSISECDDS